MGVGSGLAIYLLVWVLTLFAVLPFGVRTEEEEGRRAKTGHADSAPSQPMILKKLAWTSLVAFILFIILMANYRYGWVTMSDFPQF
ncbi:MAG: DUF1467 family protein [Pacificimonas sp.]